MGCGVSSEGKLFIACEEGKVDAARLLLENGAEVDRAAENGATPLIVTCLTVSYTHLTLPTKRIV